MNAFQNLLFTTNNLNRSGYHDEMISYFDIRMLSLFAEIRPRLVCLVL